MPKAAGKSSSFIGMRSQTTNERVYGLKVQSFKLRVCVCVCTYQCVCPTGLRPRVIVSIVGSSRVEPASYSSCRLRAGMLKQFPAYGSIRTLPPPAPAGRHDMCSHSCTHAHTCSQSLTFCGHALKATVNLCERPLPEESIISIWF